MYFITIFYSLINFLFYHFPAIDNRLGHSINWTDRRTFGANQITSFMGAKCTITGFTFIPSWTRCDCEELADCNPIDISK